jgi:signal transduction histidine kinase
MAIQCHFEPGMEKLPVPIQDALWRVGREAMLNVVKHARARKVELFLFEKDNAVFLSVGDNGVGIAHLAEGKARLEVEGHYGVRGMRERLQALGGNLSIKPNRENQGTLVIASIPIGSVKEEAKRWSV